MLLLLCPPSVGRADPSFLLHPLFLLHLAKCHPAPHMLIAPATPDSSLPPPCRLGTLVLPPYASPGINQRAGEASDLWCAPASSCEHQHTLGSYEKAQTASTGEGSEGMLAVPGTSSSPSSQSGPHTSSLAPLPSPPAAQEQSWVAAMKEQGAKKSHKQKYPELPLGHAGEGTNLKL